VLGSWTVGFAISAQFTMIIRDIPFGFAIRSFCLCRCVRWHPGVLPATTTAKAREQELGYTSPHLSVCPFAVITDLQAH
jgi:hypothetical protein